MGLLLLLLSLSPLHTLWVYTITTVQSHVAMSVVGNVLMLPNWSSNGLALLGRSSHCMSPCSACCFNSTLLSL